MCAAGSAISSVADGQERYISPDLLEILPEVYAVRMPTLDTSTRILNATRALFEREGADAVSMRKVAEAVGLSPMAMYRHFHNREALLQRICDDSFHEIARHWEALRQVQDPLQRLLSTQRIYLDYALTYPHLFDHAFSTRRRNARRFPEDFMAQRSPTANVMHEAVVQAQAQGRLFAGDAWELTMSIWAHSHGLIALYRAGRFSYDDARFRSFYDRAMTRLLEGLQP